VADSPRTTHGPVIHRLIAQGIRYDVAPLPHASNASYVYPAAINRSQEIVGFQSVRGHDTAIMWTKNGIIPIGSLIRLPGGERPQSHATAINDAGAVVGVYFTSYEDVSVDGSFLYRHGRITLLKGMATATGINRYDTIVGDIYRPGIGPFAARWKAGHIKKLGTLGGHFSSAMAVGPTGTIIGESSKPGMSVHAFLWRAGEMRDMGTLGGYFSDAVAMNGKGWVVGQSGELYGPCGGSQAAPFEWRGHGHLRLMDGKGTACDARVAAINDHEMVVGGLANGDGFTWLSHTLTDLNQAVPPSTGWQVGPATDVSNRGDIVGTGTLRGQEDAYLLHPAY